MRTQAIVLGKKSLREDFLIALKSCEERGKIPQGLADPNTITFLEDPKKRMGEYQARPDQSELKIKQALSQSEGAVVVDALGLENGLAVLNSYKDKWDVTDDIVDKLYIVVYDPLRPHRAEIVRDIKEALVLLEKFDKENRVVFVAAEGHATNFYLDLEAYEKRLAKQGIELPEFERIDEMNPKTAFLKIRAKVAAGKNVFVHESLLRDNTTIRLMNSSFTEQQQQSGKKIRFIKERKNFT